MKNIYKENGYKSRKYYLQCMAENYGIALDAVQAIADVLGPLEDFDGLISALEDVVDY